MPAKVTGSSSHKLSRPRQVELARRIVDDLRELLTLRGHEVSRSPTAMRTASRCRACASLFVPAYEGGGDGEQVVLTLEHGGGEPPAGMAVLDLLERTIHGSAEPVVLDSVREFCRKRGIRFEPGPWRYRGGLI